MEELVSNLWSYMPDNNQQSPTWNPQRPIHLLHKWKISRLFLSLENRNSPNTSFGQRRDLNQFCTEWFVLPGLCKVSSLRVLSVIQVFSWILFLHLHMVLCLISHSLPSTDSVWVWNQTPEVTGNNCIHRYIVSTNLLCVDVFNLLFKW
jgi:hypothetical protein